MKNLLLSIIILVSLGQLASCAGVPQETQESVSAYPFASDYINISSSSDFEKYDMKGHGTPEDPYVIEGLNLQDHVGNGIVVKDVSAHLLIKNCSMENLTGRYTLRGNDHISALGISVEGAENVRVENCSVPGIAFKGVKNGYLVNSTSSDDIIVEGNPRSGSFLIEDCQARKGLHIMGIANCIVENCQIENGEFAVLNLINSTFRNLTVTNCSFFPSPSGLSKVDFEKLNLVNTTILIISTNPDECKLDLKNSTVDGREVYYYQDKPGQSIRGLKAGYIWLYNCSGSVVDDVEASLVFIARSPGTILKNSKIYEGGQGIVIAFSRDCVIDNNRLPQSLEGIIAGRFDMSSDNLTLSRNTVKTLRFGGELEEKAGIQVSTKSNRIIDNLVADSQNGILVSGTNNTISGNILVNNDVGARLEGNYNNVTGNSFIYNGQNGLQEKSRFAPSDASLDNNTWDGNFWAAYFGQPSSSYDLPDKDDDGIGDVPYRIGLYPGGPVDRRPLMKPVAVAGMTLATFSEVKGG